MLFNMADTEIPKSDLFICYYGLFHDDVRSSGCIRPRRAGDFQSSLDGV